MQEKLENAINAISKNKLFFTFKDEDSDKDEKHYSPFF